MIQITLQATVLHQLQFCEDMWDEFKVKKIKRRFQAPGQHQSKQQEEPTSRKDVENAVADKSIEEVTRKSIGMYSQQIRH